MPTGMTEEQARQAQAAANQTAAQQGGGPVNWSGNAQVQGPSGGASGAPNQPFTYNDLHDGRRGRGGGGNQNPFPGAPGGGNYPGAGNPGVFPPGQGGTQYPPPPMDVPTPTVPGMPPGAIPPSSAQAEQAQNGMPAPYYPVQTQVNIPMGGVPSAVADPNYYPNAPGDQWNNYTNYSNPPGYNDFVNGLLNNPAIGGQPISTPQGPWAPEPPPEDDGGGRGGNRRRRQNSADVGLPGATDIASQLAQLGAVHGGRRFTIPGGLQQILDGMGRTQQFSQILIALGFLPQGDVSQFGGIAGYIVPPQFDMNQVAGILAGLAPEDSQAIQMMMSQLFGAAPPGMQTPNMMAPPGTPGGISYPPGAGVPVPQPQPQMPPPGSGFVDQRFQQSAPLLPGYGDFNMPPPQPAPVVAPKKKRRK